MSIIEAIILGIVQGLTEFLPVSSSGHLELVKHLFGSKWIASESLLFTVSVHFATAMSTVVVFRKDILEIIKGLFQFEWNFETKFTSYIILSMFPAAIVGLFFEDTLESLFSGQIILVGMMLLITGLLLILADKARYTEKSVGWKQALIIGLSQAIAIMPGISRSGATISTSVLLGIDRTKSARFSFLMVLPLIFGKMFKDLLGGEFYLDDDKLFNILIATVAAFIAGILACRLMINLVRNSKLIYFAVYCFIIGLIAIISQYL